MASDISKILDQCLARIARGETVEDCLRDFPNLEARLKPLLQTAQELKSVPPVHPGEEFRQASKARLLNRIRSESESKDLSRQKTKGSGPSRHLRGIYTPRRWVLVPVSIVIVLTMLFVLLPGDLNPFKTQTVSAAEVTLSILRGNVKILTHGSEDWQQGSDGLLLEAGSQVRTEAESHAVLTFIDGSTAKLDPDSGILILTSEYNKDSSIRVSINQYSGSVWSHLVRYQETSIHYEILTKSANIIADGTSFVTEVTNEGTKVTTIEGSVRVESGDTEVNLEQDYQVMASSTQVVQPPQPVARVLPELLISTNSSAVISLRDPEGSSTGFFPSGISFIQIKGSRTWLNDDGQIIKLNQPRAGEYILVVRRITRDQVDIELQVTVGERVVNQLSKVIVDSQPGWIIRFKFDPALPDQGIRIISIDPLNANNPEKVIVTDIAEKQAVSLAEAGLITSVTRTPSIETQPTKIPDADSIEPGVIPSTAPTTRPDGSYDTTDSEQIPDSVEVKPNISSTTPARPGAKEPPTYNTTNPDQKTVNESTAIPPISDMPEPDTDTVNESPSTTSTDSIER
jgi:hypothetical protein